MQTHSKTSLRFALSLGIATLSIALAPAACLYPEYTFDEPEPTASTSSSTSGGQGGNGGEAGTGGQAGQGGQGGNPLVEDCLNGKDDDNDAATDCADPDCNTGYACIPAAPVGWIGFISLYEGVPAQEPACPTAFPSSSPYRGNAVLNVPAHTCNPCACGAPTGESCNLAGKLNFSDKPCGQGAVTTSPLDPPNKVDGTCYGPSGLQGGQSCPGGPCNTSVSAAKPVVTGGSCAATGGEANLPPIEWTLMGKGCTDAPIGGGCTSGEVCQPKTTPPFLPGLCVYKGGDNSCPAGPFSTKHVFYEDVSDTRACSTCTCSTPTGSSCEISISIYSDQSVNVCNTQITTFNAGNCANLAGNPGIFGRKATITTPPNGGTCAVTNGGTASGTLTPTNATTFCCIP